MLLEDGSPEVPDQLRRLIEAFAEPQKQMPEAEGGTLSAG